MRFHTRRNFLASVAATLGCGTLVDQVLAQQTQGRTTEPVYRISKKDPVGGEQEPHPLDPALQIAYSTLGRIRASIKDYTAIVIKREQVGGKLGDYEYMGAKIRNRVVSDGQIVVPFSVYLTFLKPASVKGREVIFVEGRNGGKLTAHEGGMKGRFLPTVSLDPNGMMAMRGQRYPITEMGIENLVTKLIEKGERDKKQGTCGVEFLRGAKVGGRPCTVLSVKHDEKLPCFDFHLAQIFIDEQLKIPVRYCAYEWPSSQGGTPSLLEEYTYQNIKLNVGLTDADFDTKNPKYNF